VADGPTGACVAAGEELECCQWQLRVFADVHGVAVVECVVGVKIGEEDVKGVPVVVLANLETVVLGEAGIFLVATRLGQGSPVFLVLHVGEAFEKEEGQDVGLEIGGVNRASEDVGGFPEMGFELRQGYADGRGFAIRDGNLLRFGRKTATKGSFPIQFCTIHAAESFPRGSGGMF